MDELQWLPIWPSQFSLLTTVAMMLLTGGLAARVFCPILRIPEISIYLLCGLMLGPTGIGVISADATPGLVELTDLALGLVLFELARRVDLTWLLRERWALATAALQFTFALTGLSILFIQLGFAPLEALVAASIGATTSPMIVLRVAQEARAEGQVTDRLLHAVVVQSLCGVLVFSIALQMMHVAHTPGGLPGRWLQPAYLLAGSVTLGLAASLIARHGVGAIKPSQLLNATVLFSLLLILIEANQLLKLSPLISIIVFGMTLDTRRRRAVLPPGDTRLANAVLFTFLFVSLGSTIKFEGGWIALGTGLLVLALRWGLMAIPSAFLAKANGLTVAKGVWLASSMLPVSTLSLLFLGHATAFYPQLGQEPSRLLNAMLIITYAIGPLVTWWALRASGETHNDA